MVSGEDGDGDDRDGCDGVNNVGGNDDDGV
jgi:hypothetical protein